MDWRAGFFVMPLSTLQQIQAQAFACLSDSLVAHQSYSIAGVSITRANADQICGVTALAIARLTGQTVQSAVANFNPNIGPGHRGPW